MSYDLKKLLVQEVDAESNPFAPGNEKHTPPEVFSIREDGSGKDSPGWKVRVVPNRFPALRVEGDLGREAVGFYDMMNGIGAHEVVIETPSPAMALELQALTDIANVLKAYRARILDLSKDSRFRYLMVFKNVGPMAGASLPHPHSQIIALPVTPMVIKEKLVAAEQHFRTKDRNLFADILHFERKEKVRMVYENMGFAAFCPFASRFPFELCIMPKKQSPDFHASNDHDLILLSDCLRKVLMAYRIGLDIPDYNLILHTAPIRRPQKGYWQSIDFDFRWHIEILPRMAGIAGFEFGTGFHINPTLPEEAADFLRKVKTDV